MIALPPSLPYSQIHQIYVVAEFVTGSPFACLPPSVLNSAERSHVEYVMTAKSSLSQNVYFPCFPQQQYHDPDL